MTRASETEPNAENAWRRTSSLTSLDRSPTKMWKWFEVSSLLEVLDWYAQLTRISCAIIRGVFFGGSGWVGVRLGMEGGSRGRGCKGGKRAPKVEVANKFLKVKLNLQLGEHDD